MDKPRKIRILGCVIVTAMFAASGPVFAGKSAPSAALSADAVNGATLDDSPGAAPNRAAVLRAQVLLDRAHYSPGEIDGNLGSTTRGAVAAYQTANGISASGNVDAATWSKLTSDAAPILDTYTITDKDVAGPFRPIPTDMMAKSALPSLDYSSSAELLGEKFHVSPTLLRQLNPDRNLSKAGENIVVPNVVSATPLPATAKVVVDRSDSSVSLLDAAGKTIARFPATTGSEHDPLPVGDWVIQEVSRNPVFHYNPALFWDANPSHSKAEIKPGPNNPVGVVWVGLSKEHYGIHGTPEPSKISKTQSHGCIRLTNWDASTLADSVSKGMPALLQE